MSTHDGSDKRSVIPDRVHIDSRLLQQPARSGEVARFRNNSLRRDLPWDALPDVRYPEPDRLQGLVDGFHVANHYGDREDPFAELHPVRQAVRMFWRIGRIAPFPDFNLTMAFLVMNAHLRRLGYPLFRAEPGDRRRFQDLVRSAVPLKCLFVEQRLLAIAGE